MVIWRSRPDGCFSRGSLGPQPGAARRQESDLAGGARVLFLLYPRPLGTSPWTGRTDEVGVVTTLHELHDDLVTHVITLRALNRDTAGNQFASDIILTFCKRLLPKKMLSLWEDKILETEEDPGQVETFFAFLHKHAEI
ncbi:hypothetical protein T05_5420 [Trichinella murrelli]|uniref:Uncharacterized protein n=1 Tax=Trichinella murrelli TaxID=144512 RepID=A0A0V0T5W3_9BILA|nr:hypothetical protein T05_5420 [Trichinella murrelli]